MTFVMRRVGQESVTLKFREVVRQTNGEQTSCNHFALFDFDVYQVENGPTQAHITCGPEDQRVKTMALGGFLRAELEALIKAQVLNHYPKAGVVTISVGI